MRFMRNFQKKSFSEFEDFQVEVGGFIRLDRSADTVTFTTAGSISKTSRAFDSRETSFLHSLLEHGLVPACNDLSSTLFESERLLSRVRGIEYRSVIKLSSVMHGDDSTFSDFISFTLLNDFMLELVSFFNRRRSLSHNLGARLQLDSVCQEEIIEVVSVFTFLFELVPRDFLTFPEGVLLAC